MAGGEGLRRRGGRQTDCTDAQSHTDACRGPNSGRAGWAAHAVEGCAAAEWEDAAVVAAAGAGWSTTRVTAAAATGSMIWDEEREGGEEGGEEEEDGWIGICRAQKAGLA